MKKSKLFFCGLISIIIIISTGCIGFSDPISRGIGRGIGRAAGEHAEQEAYKKMAPSEKLPPPRSANWGNFMAMQAQIAFTYSFTIGGLWLGQVGYEPGEKGNHWWRVSWIDGEDTWIYESLISSGGNLLRLRAKDTDGNEGEIPVSGEQIYYPPRDVTKESIEGATIGQENLETKAGVFKCDHVKFMAVYGQGNVEWWLSNKVPGGVVKYQIVDQGNVIWTSTLVAKGADATTILSSY
jgi:hypothetical protein